MNLDNDLYLTDEEIRYEIENTEGLELIEETDSYYEVHDTFNGTERYVRFNKEDYLVNQDMIQSYGHNIDKYRVLEFLQTMPKILLMNLRKVHILSTYEDLESFNEATGIYSYDIWNKSLYDWESGNVVLSIIPHESQIDNMYDLDGDFLDEENVMVSIWISITKELFHTLQSNPIFDGQIEQGEEIVEEYCSLLFHQSRGIEIESIEV